MRRRGFGGEMKKRAGGADGAGLRILVMEDKAGEARWVGELLSQAAGKCPDYCDMELMAGEDGPVVSSRLSQAGVNAVLLDASVSKSRCLATLQKLAPAVPQLPVIVLTDQQDESMVVEVLRLGAQDCLVKGKFDGHLLIRALRYAMERKKAEIALRRSETMFRDFVENAEDLIWQVDVNGAYVYLSPNAESILGYAPKELLGRSPFDLMPPREAKRVAGIFAKVVKERKAFSLLQHAAIRKDGKLRTLECGGKPVFDERGRLTGYRGIDRDITERRRIEEKLQESEGNFRRLVEQAADALFLHDRRGNLLDVNRAACDSLGYDRGELLRLPVYDLEIGLSREAMSRLWQELRSSGPRTVEGVHRRKDGTVFPVEMRLGMFESKEGPLVLAMARDITERKQAEAALRESEERLRQSQKLETVGRLAGGIAHDFNNLLTAIGAYSRFLLEDLEPGDKRRADVEEIRRAGERAAGLTRQLLAFSRRQVLNPEVLSLNSVVEGVEKMLRRTIGENIELVAALSSDLKPVQVDPGQMEQIIVNLAVNARDAMPHGGKLILETANVEFMEAQDYGQFSVPGGRYAMLAVSDTGAGMDKETLSHLFEPFFTTKEQGKGTGLGLSTVYGIVKQSKGYILVYSEPGQGSTFKIYLPWISGAVPSHPPPQQPSRTLELEAPVPAGAAPCPAPLATLSLSSGTREIPGVRDEPRKPAVPAGREPETILLVEDDPVVFRPTLRSLRQSGYNVLGSCSGEEALEICRRCADKIDLVITDMVMPRISGRELVRRLSALRPGLKTLFISGYTDEAVLQSGALAPGTPFLQKPFTPAVLARKVREVLDSATSQTYIPVRER